MLSDIVAHRLRVMELLLESVTNPAKLRPALCAMTELMAAELGMLASGRRSTASVYGFISTAPGPEGHRDGAAEFPSFGLYRRWGLTQPAGRLHSGRAIVEFAGRHGASTAEGPPPPLHGDCHIAHIDTGADHVCYVGFARSAEKAFTAERIAALESLLPALGKAFAINRQFESTRAVSLAAMNRYERYHVGVALVDEDGLLQYRNEAARQLFECGDGLRIAEDGRIDARQGAETEALLQAIREHIGGELPDSHFAPALLRVTRGGDAAPLALAISPYRGGAERLGSRSRRGNAVIMIYDPDRPPVEGGELIRRQFALSPQEADLVCAIAGGSSLDEFARRSDRTLEAVRSQLKRVFRKTGTSRQTELVKLVLSGPACMVQ